ncbi:MULTISPECIES: type VI secretion system Vgr family protein [unclassified Janthinobacterium]|uniref:type VI secretion system Vgr family protein n=1 Tax=unclassified Janthinobacterium TaxID=2610881 RepID=UPI00034BB5AC|nr:MULTISPECIES: type VI secretion system tip protein TssI/VgrG [unclassified Janthinobacterium]MEC5159445.1 type VI secretion system secreted protein VgrG [Janthinobacterium sp. CG_S6]
MGTEFQHLQEMISARQRSRILRLAFPNNDGPPFELVVNKLNAVESLSRDFEFTIELLSDRANLALKDMQGKMLSVALVQANGTLRYFSGYCFTFCLKKAGNISYYEATLGPWLKYLTFGKDNYLFHNKTLREQTASMFGDYAVPADWDLRFVHDDPAMTDAMQFRESDHNYLHRRWEAAGWHYYYIHTDRGHKLVLSDDSTRADPIDDDPEIRFHRHGGSLEEEAISEWSSLRQLIPSSVTLAGFDFKQPYPRQVSVPTVNRQGRVADTESYEYVGAYGFKDRADGDAQARLRMQEMEAAAKQFKAATNNRRVAPGYWFSFADRLDENPFGYGNDPGRNQFLIIEVQHVATNNYLQETDEAPHYRNHLTCIRKIIPWRPGRGYNSVDVRMLGPQTAIVVGPAGDGSIHTDQYGRIRVQFHWDRVGGNDEGSSSWMRVGAWWAGNQLGATAIPRVGSEVVVHWLDGSPDRPYVANAIHNERYMPSWSLPAQRALTGFRTRELTPGGGGNNAAGRSNHLIFDDSYKKIQVQLKSDHQHSQLSLGSITRIEGNAGRTDARGEGWELATDGWGVARAGKGLLITTEARPRAASHIKDMGETLQRLAAAREQHEEQAAAARQQGAQEQPGQQADVSDAIKVQNDAIKGAGSAEAFPELAAPHLVLASPAGIETTTAQSTHIASDQHTAITTGKHFSVATGDSFFASVSQTFRLFVHKAGMKLIAASGKVSIQAQSDEIDIIAKKVLALISEQDWVEIRGKLGVRFSGGTDTLEISDTSQFFTRKPVLFHGNLETLPSRTAPPPPDVLPEVLATAPKPGHLQHTLQSHTDGKRYAHVPYALYKDGAKVEDGLTDEFGRILVEHQTGTPRYTVKLPNGEEIALNANANLASADESQSNVGMRALHDTPESRHHD